MTKNKHCKKKSTINHLFQLGMKDIGQNNYSEAIKRFESVLNSQPNNEKALYFAGLAHFMVNNIEKTIKYLKQLLESNPDHEEALHIVGLAFFNLKNIAGALESLNKLLEINPNHSEGKELLTKVWLHNGYQNYLDTNYSAAHNSFNKALVYSPNNSKILQMLRELNEPSYYETIIAPKIYKAEFKAQFDALKEKHKTLNTMTAMEHIEWIVEIIEFILANYQFNIPPFSFINTDYLEESERGFKLRAEMLVHMDNTLITNVVYHLYPLPSQESNRIKIRDHNYKKAINILSDYLFFTDLIKLMRMMFETIHHLPRDYRNQFYKHLPWGESSWFNFDQLGSIFFTNFDNQNKFECIIVQNAKTEAFQSFVLSLQEYINFVKVSLVTILDEDLLLLKDFFSSILTYEKTKKPRDIKNITHLPNLSILQDYFKQSFNLWRMLNHLPYELNKTTRPNLSQIEISRLTDFNLYLLRDKLTSLLSLKEKLAFLRQICCFGELFTNRNFGSDLELIDFIDPVFIKTIRNGLVHIEDLQSTDTITSLENSDEILGNLNQELYLLRNKLVDYISKRQEKFPWPAAEGKPIREWFSMMQKYLHVVKNEYNSSCGFNSTSFAPNKPLLPEEDIETLLGAFRNESVEDELFIKKLRLELLGISPLSSKYLSQIKDHLKKDYVSSKEEPNKQASDNCRKIDILYCKADKQYNQLKNEQIKIASQKNKNEQQQVTTQRRIAMQDYPTIEKVAKSLTTNKEKIMPASELLKNIQIRLDVLNTLLQNSCIVFEPNSYLPTQYDNFKKLLKEDTELFFSTSYLATQLISMMNRFSSLMVLEEYKEEQSSKAWLELAKDLKSRLPDWVALRNILMHPDGIIESQETCYFHIDFHQLPDTIGYFIIDLLSNFQQKFQKLVVGVDEKIVFNTGNKILQVNRFQIENFKQVFDEICASFSEKDNECVLTCENNSLVLSSSENLVDVSKNSHQSQEVMLAKVSETGFFSDNTADDDVMAHSEQYNKKRTQGRKSASNSM